MTAVPCMMYDAQVDVWLRGSDSPSALPSVVLGFWTCPGEFDCWPAQKSSFFFFFKNDFGRNEMYYYSLFLYGMECQDILLFLAVEVFD